MADPGRWRDDVVERARGLLRMPPIGPTQVLEREVLGKTETAFREKIVMRSPSGINDIVVFRVVPNVTVSQGVRVPAIIAIPDVGEFALSDVLGERPSPQRDAALRFAALGYAVYVPEELSPGSPRCPRRVVV